MTTRFKRPKSEKWHIYPSAELLKGFAEGVCVNITLFSSENFVEALSHSKYGDYVFETVPESLAGYWESVGSALTSALEECEDYESAAQTEQPEKLAAVNEFEQGPTYSHS